MSDKYKFELGEWYMTQDYQELYKIVYNAGEKAYTVIKYFDGSTMYHGSLYKVQKYMEDNCISHDQYQRWCILNGK